MPTNCETDHQLPAFKRLPRSVARLIENKAEASLLESGGHIRFEVIFENGIFRRINWTQGLLNNQIN